MVDATITNDKDSLTFKFLTISNLKNSKKQPSIDVPFIGGSAANRLIFKFTGQAQDLSYNFVLYTGTTDVASGTHTSAVTTIADQVSYLMDTFWVSDFDAEFTITIPSEDTLSATGTIESI